MVWTLSKQMFKPFKAHILKLDKVVNLILQFYCFAIWEIFFKNILMNPSHEEIEFGKRLCIYFFAKSFKEEGMKRNLKMSYSTLGNYIIEHTSSNSLRNR